MGLLGAIQDEQFWRDVAKNGRGLLQGASNAAATNMTGPVDAINMGLGLLGLPVSREPLGGDAWAKRMGLVAPASGPAAMAGETLGLIAPVLGTARAPQIASGLLKMADNAMAPRTMNSQTGAIVWHGSPHKFDKFDASKIGTGEGAQAYGHGLYFAESPAVAKGYAKKLTDAQNLAGASGKTYTTAFNGSSQAMDDAVSLINSGMYKSVDEAINTTSQILSSFKPGDPRIAILSNRLEAYKSMANDAVKIPEQQLYKVDLPDNAIARMLDWDKPLSQQPQAFKDAVSAREQQRMMPILEQRRATLAGLPQGAENASILKKQIAILEDEITQPQAVPNMTGGEYFNYLRNREMAPAEQADWLRKAGIPGIRYLDGGSRGAGAGSSNFVVFPGEESLLSILERNGKALP